MSSTEFTIGLESSRNSSKVLKPPGGGSSDIFGVGSAESSVQKDSKESSTNNRLFGSETANSKVCSIPQRNASNIFTGEVQTSVSRKKQYVRRNPITGEGFESSDSEKPAENEKENDDKTEDNKRENKAVHNESDAPTKVITTSIRVRNPPGGKSSGIF